MASNYEQKDNSGTLFKNDRKEKDTHPDYRGSALIGGKDYWMNAWIKKGKRGAFMSFSFQQKDERRPETTKSQVDDDEVPF